jgi:hypothetical protein
MSQRKKIDQYTEKVDHATGESLSSERHFTIEREPDYVKLYLQGILLYSDCPQWQNKVLHSLLKRINYQNEISLPVGYKREIVKELSISMSSLNNAISAFVRTKLLIRKDVGVYLANPHLFGRGEWKDIRKLRLMVEFSEHGVQMEGEISKNESVDDNVEKASQELMSSVLPVDTAKLMAFLKNPANHTEAIALSSVAVFLGFSFSCFYQVLI